MGLELVIEPEVKPGKTLCPITGMCLPKKIYTAKPGSGIQEVKVGKLKR